MILALSFSLLSYSLTLSEVVTMAFHKSSCDMHLVTKSGATFLAAICNNDEGSGLTTDIPLDKYLGNEDGVLLP